MRKRVARDASTTVSRAKQHLPPTAAERRPEEAALPSEAADEALRAPELYINRELSLLEFNRRVLAMARDPDVPLLERLRFLTICTSNLDEFFEIRVSGLKEQISAQVAAPTPDGQAPKDSLRRISEVTHDLVREQYAVLFEELLPALFREGIEIVFRRDWDLELREYAARLFETEVLPVLTPVGLDPAHPFPTVLNKSLNFFIALDGQDAFGRPSNGAVLQAPRLLPRLLKLPASISQGRQRFVTLSSVISENVGQLFPGMKVIGCWAFRVTRNSDLFVNEEEVDDLLQALEGELPRRHYGHTVRLEVDQGCPVEVCKLLLDEFALGEDDLYRVEGPVNLHRLSELVSLVDRKDLKYPPFVQRRPDGLDAGADLFRAIRERDILLHHPFQSFAPVEAILDAAAHDPDVLAIKVTLYRTGKDAPLTESLVDAAQNGKEVTAIVELRARFDEAANIHTATKLQKAGAKVAYGVVGYKAHVKMMLIVRREADGLRRYVHLGTGNYHTGNTNSYTDFGLLTADPEIALDVHDLFQQLTGLGQASRMKKLLQSPFTLHRRVLELIEAERQAALQGQPSGIRAKMNSLIEPRVIRALYRASQAGVPIDLIVRGMCSLRPGLPGISETIRVRSVIGRFLEHARVFHFHAQGQHLVYGSSADWMERNFFRRVETAFPLEDPRVKARVLGEGIDIYWQDDCQAWDLTASGSYVRARPATPPGFSAQQELLKRSPLGI